MSSINKTTTTIDNVTYRIDWVQLAGADCLLLILYICYWLLELDWVQYFYTPLWVSSNAYIYDVLQHGRCEIIRWNLLLRLMLI